MLYHLFHSTKGDPNRKEIRGVADALNLREVQVYKWIWDTKQRQERNTAELLECHLPLKAVFNIEHRDGLGNSLSPYEVQFALQLHKENSAKENI